MNIEQIHDMLEDGIGIVKSSTSDIRDITNATDGITKLNNVLEEIKRIKNQKYYFDTEIKVLQSEDDLRESYRESEKPEDSTFEDYVDYLVNFAGTLIEVDELRF